MNVSRPRIPVSLHQCTSYDPIELRDALHSLLEPLGGMSAFVKPGQKVLLKPNLIVPRPAEAAVSTDPGLVMAVAEMARQAGGEVVVGDSPAFSSAAGVARAMGLLDRLRKVNIPLIDLGRGSRRVRLPEDARPWKSVTLSKAALDADVVINLPKVKAHSQAGLSLGLKNLYGTIAGKRKALYHFQNGPDVRDFGKLIVAVARRIAPALTIEDGIVLLERDGPTAGDPRPGNFLVASADCTAADRVTAALLTDDLSRIFYLQSAAEMGHGAESLDEIEVLGHTIDQLKIPNFVPAQREVPINFTLPRVIKSVIRQAGFLWRARRETNS